MDETQPLPVSEAGFTLLFVDDEANILSSLKRLFRQFGYRIFTAENGMRGLEIMEQETVDMVISDMRMPGMSGAQFLEQIREKWPETVRILLTGYAEISSTIEAINKGQIYRYISKPWEDNDIVLTVKHALQQKQLEKEKLRLEALTRKQNEELKDLNANLEEKVRARTEELRQTMAFLEDAHERLKKGFVTSIRVFSGLIEMRNAAMMGHSRRVAEMARSIAQRMGMSNGEVQNVFIAGLLLDIGKIGLPDDLLTKPYTHMTAEERSAVAKCPVKGQMALMALEQLQDAAKLIRSHREWFNGTGYPDRLAGSNIPLGARILALVKDYDAVQIGALQARHMNEADAVLLIQDGKGEHYDPLVVDAFMNEIVSIHASEYVAKTDVAMRAGQLIPGMALSRDLVAETGEMLLSKDHVLTEFDIEQILYFEHIGGKALAIYINVK